MKTKVLLAVMLFLSFFATSLVQAGMPYPKIFIHGLDGTCNDWEGMATRMASDGRPYFTCVALGGLYDDLIPIDPGDGVSLYNNGAGDPLPVTDPDSFWNVDYYYSADGYYHRDRIGEYAVRLATIIDDIKVATGAGKVILIGHSMGGLVARRYMANSTENWESVHRFITAGTPNIGVYGVFGWAGGCDIIVGNDCEDIDDSSTFIHQLYDGWFEMKELYKGTEHAQNRIWGVLGGTFGDRNGNDPTDGDGWVEVWSAIPGEWKLAKEDAHGRVTHMTPNYGYRIAYNAAHSELLTDDETADAIAWADSEDYNDIPNQPGISMFRDTNYNKGIGADFREYYPLTFRHDVQNFNDMLTDVWGDGWVESLLFQDQVTSITVDAPGALATAYVDAFYVSTSLNITANIQDLGAYGLNDTISSVSFSLIDTDGDSLPDYWEEFYGTDPFTAGDSDTDSDGDGLSDADEFAELSNPIMVDTDGDGMDDGWEAYYNLVPYLDDAGSDFDLDGVSNFDEYLAGTHAAALKNILLKGINSGHDTFDLDIQRGLRTLTNASGMFANLWSPEFRKLHVGDFNGDGFSDVLMQGRFSGEHSYLLLSDGVSEFETVQDITYAYGGMTFDHWREEYRIMTTGDFNGDGQDDILLQGTSDAHGTFLLLSDAAGSYLDYLTITNSFGMSYAHWSAGNRKAYVGDYDGDGFEDIVLHGREEHHGTFMLRGHPTDGFHSLNDISYAYGMAPTIWDEGDRQMHVGDFNGDGSTDMLLQGHDDFQGTYMLLSDGAGGYTSTQDITNSFGMSVSAWNSGNRRLFIGDFNCDSLDDVLLQGKESSHTSFLLYGDAASGFVTVRDLSGLYGLVNDHWSEEKRAITVGDLNDDGCDDLLLQGKFVDQHTYILMTDPLTGDFLNAADVSDMWGMTKTHWSFDLRTAYLSRFFPLTPTMSDDRDGDGLTTAVEHALGTSDLDPDTDGDGLSDGDEVNTHGTDPLQTDTDGDGISDGTEITEGSDPTSSSSIACVPPASGTEWLISASCTVFSNKSWDGDVIVEGETTVVEISSGVALDLNLSSAKLIVRHGSGILVRHGGKIH